MPARLQGPQKYQDQEERPRAEHPQLIGGGDKEGAGFRQVGMGAMKAAKPGFPLVGSDDRYDLCEDLGNCSMNMFFLQKLHVFEH